MKFLIVFLSIQSVFAKLDTTWWRHTTIYEIFIWSFKDSNGDGIGDLKGITSKLNHFKKLGIGSLYITPFFLSPMVDMGYDISNYTTIDPRFGTMDDFDEMIREMKKRDLKLIIDIVINHSSEQHPWFLKSINREHPYTDYYVWCDPKDFDENDRPLAPTNWISLFEGSAWTWNAKRKQFYLHQFSPMQPDFNLRNKHLKKEIQFWLEKGVAGFRLDAAIQYFEDEQFRNEPLSIPPPPPQKKTTEKIKYKEMLHIYTTNLPETYEYIRTEIRALTDNYSRNQGDFERIVIGEVFDDWNHTVAYYGEKNNQILHFPYNLKFKSFNGNENSTEYKNIMSLWYEKMPNGAVANWASESHDITRLGNKVNEPYTDILLIIIMMAPGVAFLYYGQEIGMMNGMVRIDQRKDPGGAFGINRDGERVPMQWDNTINAGFSNNRNTWLPVNPEYWRVNVEIQKKTKNSRYHLLKDLLNLRKTKTLKHGSIETYVISPWVFAFTRTYKGHETYVIVINLGSEMEMINIHTSISNLSLKMPVITSSLNSGYEKGTIIIYRAKFPQFFVMPPQSSVVLKSISEQNYELN